MSARGHVFVVRGDLRRLVADAWLLPADKRLGVSRSWRDAAPVRHDLALPDGWGMDGVRVVQVPGTRPACWVGNVGGYGRPPAWYAEAARQFIRHAGIALRGQSPVAGRSLPLLALPVVGTGYGGGRYISGAVAKALIDVVAEEAAANAVDVCVVCWEDAAYAALQRARADLVRERPGSAAGWKELGADLIAQADALGGHALDGSLVLFLGAGLSTGAGLPSWSQLLDDLARVAGVDADQRKALTELPELDRARIVEGRLNAAGATLDAEIAVGMRSDRYPVAQGLAASLPVGEVVTMNYDELFEMASAGAGRPVAVLPWEPARSQTRWLLKMHGCARRGDIVLTRHHYHRYEQARAALAGIVQALLITRHMLFLGFSLTDPNFHRIIDDVRQAVRRENVPAHVFGTAIVLRDEPLMNELWRGDINFVPVGAATGNPGEASRKVELLLDRLAFVATDDTAHLMDPAYDGILDPHERWLRDNLRDLRDRKPHGVETTKAWRIVEQLLRDFGDPAER